MEFEYLLSGTGTFAADNFTGGSFYFIDYLCSIAFAYVCLANSYRYNSLTLGLHGVLKLLLKSSRTIWHYPCVSWGLGHLYTSHVGFCFIIYITTLTIDLSCPVHHMYTNFHIGIHRYTDLLTVSAGYEFGDMFAVHSLEENWQSVFIHLNLNPLRAGTELIRFNKVNIMVAAALAPVPCWCG